MRFMLVLPLVLIGCATAPTPQAVALVDADPTMIQGCQYVGLVTGKSLVGGLMQSIGKANAKAEVENEAVARGATHLVWQSLESGMGGGDASARAYRCAT